MHAHLVFYSQLQLLHAQERLAHMDEEDMEDMDEDYILASRLEAGLFTLQQSAIIMANLWYYNDVHLRKRILLLLHQQVPSMSSRFLTPAPMGCSCCSRALSSWPISGATAMSTYATACCCCIAASTFPFSSIQDSGIRSAAQLLCLPSCDMLTAKTSP